MHGRGSSVTASVLMRFVLVALANLLLFLRTLAGWPFRKMRAGTPQPWVRFRLEGALSYREPRRRLLRRKAPEPGAVSSLHALGRALDQLASDTSVRGILLDVEGVTLPGAHRDAVISMLEKFRGAGKRVVGHAVTLDASAFQVLCAADEILLAPAGRLELVGFHAEATALGTGLAKLGVTAHFVRRGAYKTAPELFTHPEASDIQRETIESFLDERYAGLIGSIVRGRSKSEEEARALVDAGPYSARRAEAAGLIDGRVSAVDLAGHLGIATGKEPDDEARLPGTYPDYLQRLAWPPVAYRPWKRPPRLALVEVKGMIAPGKGGASPLGPRMAGSDTLVKAVRAAARDKRARAILLHVTSPGGSAMASEILLEAIRRAALKKPVIAYADTVSASGGYMAMLGAREIWSSPHAMVGSIGVFAGKFDFSGLLAKLGIHRTVLTRGKNAGLHSPSRGLTSSERRSLEAEVEETYQAFLEDVARARGRTREEIHARAEGRVYSGTRALAAGLVDQLGSFEAACARALELGQASWADFELKRYERPPARFPLLGLLGGARGVTVQLALCPWTWEGELVEGLREASTWS